MRSILSFACWKHRHVEIQGGFGAGRRKSFGENKNIIRYKIEDCEGKYIKSAINNASYLGHIVTKDKDGLNARKYAQETVNSIIFETEEA